MAALVLREGTCLSLPAFLWQRSATSWDAALDAEPRSDLQLEMRPKHPLSLVSTVAVR